MRRTLVNCESPNYPVAGVSNVLNLLLLLEERQRVKLSDVSTNLEIGASTAHRLLSMFKTFGFVEQDEASRAYLIGPDLITLASSIASKNRILSQVRPLLCSLVEETNETVHLAMLSGASVIYMDCVESKKTERATPRTGRAMPAYATASGKALLADIANEGVCELFPTESLAKLTAHTLKTRADLLQDLVKIRERGFALNENESQLGYFSYACPIRKAGIKHPLAIVVAAPSRRFRKTRHRLAELLCQSAEAAASVV